MKRYLILTLCLLVALTAFTSVYGSEEGKLLIWADDTRSPILQEVGKDFTKKYKIEVQVQELNFNDISDQLSIVGPSGNGPDILIGAHDWLGKLVVNGLVEPIDLDAKEKDFAPVAISAFSWGNELYGVPYAVESIGLIYNKKLVPKAPKTWDELVAMGKKIADPKKKQWGFVLPQPDPYHTFPIMAAGGGYVFGKNADGTLNPLDIGLNNKGAVQGMELLRDLIEDGIMPTGIDPNTMATLFKEGKVGMIISGPWYFQDFRAAGIDFGFTAIPSINGKPSRPFAGVHGFMVSSFSKNKLLAQAFLNEYIVSEEVMYSLYEKGDRPPAFLPALKKVKNADIKGIYNSASEGVPMPNIPEMNSVWSAWSNAIEVILNGTQASQAALDNAVGQIKTAIEQAKK